jgi:hypothetical protein
MSDIKISEACSCGAKFSVTGSSYRSLAGGGTNGAHRSAEEMAERWRTDHRHEFAPASSETTEPREVDVPGSQTEREQEWGGDDRMGFLPESRPR